MKDINIRYDTVLLKEISEYEAEKIYLWYSKEVGYADATGLNTGLSWEKFDRMWRQAILKQNEFFLAIYYKESSEVAGFIKGIVAKDDPSTIFITALAIDTDLRRRGIGTNALKAILLGLNSGNGCNSVFVTVDSENNIGLQFWRKNGFHIIKTIRKRLTAENSYILVNLMKIET